MEEEAVLSSQVSDCPQLHECSQTKLQLEHCQAEVTTPVPFFPAAEGMAVKTVEACKVQPMQFRTIGTKVSVSLAS